MKKPVTKKPAAKKTATKKAAAVVAQAPVPVAVRVSNMRERLIKDGGRLISTLVLKREAAEALALLETKEKSATKVISELLIAAAKRKR